MSTSASRCCRRSPHQCLAWAENSPTWPAPMAEHLVSPVRVTFRRETDCSDAATHTHVHTIHHDHTRDMHGRRGRRRGAWRGCSPPGGSVAGCATHLVGVVQVCVHEPKRVGQVRGRQGARVHGREAVVQGAAAEHDRGGRGRDHGHEVRPRHVAQRPLPTPFTRWPGAADTVGVCGGRLHAISLPGVGGG